MWTETKRILLGGLAAVLLASAAQAEDTTGVTDTTIKIGVPGTLTGSYAYFGAAIYGIQAYYDYVNKNGGVNGRKIEVVLGDTACNEAQGVAVAKRMIAQDKVFLINGIICSGVGLAVRPVVAESDVPWVISTAANQNISSPVVPNIFHGVQTSRDMGISMAKFALSKPGTKKIAIVAHTNEWAKGYRDPFVDYLKGQGITPIAELALERGQTDATAQVLKLKQANPDFIAVMLYEPELVAFLRDAHKYGLNVPIISSLGSDFRSTAQKLGGPAAMKNFYMAYQYKGLIDGPQMSKWREIIQANLPKGEKITDFTFYGFGSSIAVVHVLKELGHDVSRERFIQAMDNLKDFDTGVLAGTMSFSKTDHQGAHELTTEGYDDSGKIAVFTAWGKKAE